MMSSKNNHFTADDIERYHSGKMSPEERHALEKAALDDPFLADALEGYSYTTTAANDLEKIKTRLKEKEGKKKTFPFFKTYKWLSSAAIVIILAGAGWFAYSNFKNEKNALANNVPVHEAKKPEPTTNSSSDKIADTSIANQEKVLVDKPEPKTNPPEQIITSNKSSLKKIKEEVPQSKIAESKANSVDQKTEFSLTKSAERRTAFTAASASKPTIDTSNAITQKAEASNIKLRGISGDTIKNFNVTLQSKQPQLEEVVVVANGTRKNKSGLRYPTVIVDSLEPNEGDDEFGDYIADNFKLPEELETRKLSGIIQLSFDVDEEGMPVNIAVVKSLCNKCDEEAIRLLKEGPKWKKKKNKKGELTIKF